MALRRWFDDLLGQLRTGLPHLDSRAAYARWAETYPARPHNMLMQTEQMAMQELLPDLTGQVVLDLATGTGRWGRIAREGGAARVIGLDHSWPMLANNVLGQRAMAELDAIPLPAASMNVVLCGLALGHVPTPRMYVALNEIGRVLKPGGLAFASDFHPCQTWRGAQRTFRTPEGQGYAITNYPHGYADYHQAATAAGLEITAVREPRLPGQPGGMPVVLVLGLRKPMA